MPHAQTAVHARLAKTAQLKVARLIMSFQDVLLKDGMDPDLRRSQAPVCVVRRRHTKYTAHLQA